MGFMDILEPFDYPRQSAANFAKGAGNLFSGTATTNDLIGMVPGAVGGWAGGMTMSPLIGALAAGATHGVGKMLGLEAFNAPTTGDVVESFGGDRNSFLQNFATQIATDPLTFASAAMVPGVPSFGKVLGNARTPAEKMAAIAAASPDDLANELKVVANILGDVNEEFQYAKDPIRMMAARADLLDDARRIASTNSPLLNQPRDFRFPNPYDMGALLNPREVGNVVNASHMAPLEFYLATPYSAYQKKPKWLTEPMLQKGRNYGDLSVGDLNQVYNGLFGRPSNATYWVGDFSGGPKSINSALPSFSKRPRIGMDNLYSPNPLRHSDIYNNQGRVPFSSIDSITPDVSPNLLALSRNEVNPANMDSVIESIRAANYPLASSEKLANRLNEYNKNFSGIFGRDINDLRYGPHNEPLMDYFGQHGIDNFSDIFRDNVLNNNSRNMLISPKTTSGILRAFYPPGVGDDYINYLNSVNHHWYRQLIPDDQITDVANYLLDSLRSGARPSDPFPVLNIP